MSDIATKLTTIAENQKKVHEAGHAKGHEAGLTEGYDNGYSVGVTDGKEAGYKEGYDVGYNYGGAQGYSEGFAEGKTIGYNDGKEAERNEFWENLIPSAYPVAGPYMFYMWDMENFKPTKNLIFNASNHPAYAFYQTALRKPDAEGVLRNYAFDLVELLEKYNVKLSLIQPNNVISMFQQSTVTRVPMLDFSAVTNATNAFTGCIALKTIEGLKVSESTAVLNCFANCSSLENLTIIGTLAKGCNFSPCTALSHDSLMSIINALKTYTDGTTNKMAFGSTNLAKLTEEEKLLIEQKGWTYA